MAFDSEHAVTTMVEIFENEVKSDLITFIAGIGGQRFPVHRVVLTTNSKYFAALLGPNFIEADEDEFIFDEIDGATLKAIVDFCYTRRIGLTEENVSNYLTIASGIDLGLLEQECFRFLANELNEKSFLSILSIAEKFNGHVLRQEVIDFVCEFLYKIPPSLFNVLDNRALQDILKKDAVHVEERFIFACLLDWYRKDKDHRRQHMPGLLKLIRLPLIQLQYLIGDTMQMAYKEFGCCKYLCAEYKRRIASPDPNACIRQRRSRSIHCLSKQYYDDEGEQHSGVKIEQYNEALNEFEEVGKIELGQCTQFGAILHENKVYILGGMIDDVIQKSVSVFDLTTGEWRILPEMASARINFAAILVGKFIYVFGGFDDDYAMTSCERFDLEAETWGTLKPMSLARWGPAVTVLNGQICVAGGQNWTYEYGMIKEIELFTPQNGEWTALAPMNVGRIDFTIFNSKNTLHAMGFHSSIERYDPLMDRWTKIESFESRKEVFDSVVVNDHIYVIKRCGEFGEVKVDEYGGYSYLPLAMSKFTEESRRHYLFHD